MRVLIVGAGVMGLTSAWALAKRGHAVEILDAAPAIPNLRASSVDEHRIIRTAYGKLAGYADLMPEAFAAWERVFADLGARHLEHTGLVYVLREDDGWHATVSAEMARLGATFREIAPADAFVRWPMLAHAGVERVVETGPAGVLYARSIVEELARWLAAHGVALAPGAAVADVDPARGRVRLADGATREADAVLVAAGAWLPRLLPAFTERVVPSRQVVIYLEPPPELAAAWQAAPAFSDRQPGGRGVYVLPPRTGRGTRIKFGGRGFSRGGDPEADRSVRDDEVEALMTDASRALVGFERYRVVDRKACFYSVTADERFILERLDERGWALSACSGHGFKLGAFLGELAAAALAGDVDPEAARCCAAGLG